MNWVVQQAVTASLLNNSVHLSICISKVIFKKSHKHKDSIICVTVVLQSTAIIGIVDPLCQEQLKYRGRLYKSFRRKKTAICDEWENHFMVWIEKQGHMFYLKDAPIKKIISFKDWVWKINFPCQQDALNSIWGKKNLRFRMIACLNWSR